MFDDLIRLKYNKTLCKDIVRLAFGDSAKLVYIKTEQTFIALKTEFDNGEICILQIETNGTMSALWYLNEEELFGSIMEIKNCIQIISLIKENKYI